MKKKPMENVDNFIIKDNPNPNNENVDNFTIVDNDEMVDNINNEN